MDKEVKTATISNVSKIDVEISLPGIDEIRDSIKEQQNLISWLKPDSQFGSSRQCDLYEEIIENQIRIVNLIEKIGKSMMRRY